MRRVENVALPDCKVATPRGRRFPSFAGLAAPAFSVPATLFFAFPKKGMFHLVLLKVGTIFNAW
jgi:hypothetical protein